MHYILKTLFFLVVNFALLDAHDKSVTLELKWKHQFQFAGYYMAKEKGFYEKHGFDVKILEGTDKNVITDVASGNIDFGVYGSGIVVEQLKGKQLIALSSIFQHSPIHLIVKKESGIAKVSDLVGKRIMLPKNPIQAVEILAMLRRNGIATDEVNLIDTSHDILSLVNDETDAFSAYVSNEPYLLNTLGVKYTILHPKDYGIDFYNDVLFTSKLMLHEHPEIVKAFTDASLEGWEYAFEHMDETVELILKKYNTQNKTQELLLFEANELQKLIGAPIVPLGHMSESRWKDIAHYYKALGFIDKEVDIKLDGFIYDDKYHMDKDALQELLFLFGILLALLLLYHFYKYRKSVLINRLKDEYQQFFDLAPLPYQSLDINGNILKANKAWLELLEYTEEEILGRNFSEFVMPEYHSIFQKKFPLFKKEGFTRRVTFKMKTKSGEEILASYNGYTIYDKNKNFVQTHCIFEDITQVEKIQSAYKKETKRLKRAEEIAKLGSWEYDAKEDKLYWSRSIYDIFEYEDTTETTTRNIFWAKVHPDDRTASLRKYLSAVKHKKTYSFTYRVIMDDSRIKYIEARGGHRFDSDGKLIHSEGTLQDITQTMHLRDLIQSQTRKLQRAEALAHTGWWYRKIDNDLAEWSDEMYEILGEDPLEFEASHQNFISKVHPEDREKVEKLYKSALKKKHPYKYDYRILNKSGEVHYITGSAEFDLDEKGDVTHIFGTVMDVTQQKILENKLKDKEELMIAQSRQAAMGDMVSMLAHQWRQPITVVSMTANNIIVDMELKDDIQKDDIQQSCQIILNQTQVLSNTIDDFRGYLQADEEKKETTLQEVLNSTIEIIKKSLENNNIHLELTNASETKLFIFKNELLQVYLNIINNAKEALLNSKTPDAKISIAIDEKEDSIITTICDNGRGIDKQVLEKLGEPYVSTKAENGRGLGIYMSKLILQRHFKGTLTWENIDKGTCFRVEIPIKTNMSNI
ncbi:PAS domain-containing protein [Sulfurimonas aquatica]|uniref:histidine kinase n=1 Tax=Sulfurimonas aquatica TaxID=2672570 RepID=A0A975GCA1_9BACT|nr:ABC transporter substrate-binding protein [Sulfurimonas aquatica]QSZ41405.1 PAS domain-containing protein [Sulfurimonas aquatica]